MNDLRYALRQLARSPGFTTVAVLTLALGIGANTAIFSVVYGVLLKPLPYDDPRSLVSVWGARSLAEFVGVRDRNHTLQGVAAYLDRVGVSLSGTGEPARLAGALASADLFRVLGVSAAVGRTFAAGEDQPGNNAVVLLSDGLWRARFGADPSIIGRTLDLDGIPRTVIGVMPRGFWFPRRETELWLPVRMDRSNPGEFWGSGGYYMAGRLRPGMTRAQARADVRALAERLRIENPVWRPSERYYFNGLDVIPLDQRIVEGGTRRLLLVLLGAVGMVLVIACANVANLLIARGAARERELSLRSAWAWCSAWCRRCVCRGRTSWGRWAKERVGAGAARGSGGSPVRSWRPRSRSAWCSPWEQGCCSRASPVSSRWTPASASSTW